MWGGEQKEAYTLPGIQEVPGISPQGVAGKSVLTINSWRIVVVPIIKGPDYRVISARFGFWWLVEFTMVLVSFGIGCWWIWLSIALRFRGLVVLSHVVVLEEKIAVKSKARVPPRTVEILWDHQWKKIFFKITRDFMEKIFFARSGNRHDMIALHEIMFEINTCRAVQFWLVFLVILLIARRYHAWRHIALYDYFLGHDFPWSCEDRILMTTRESNGHTQKYFRRTKMTRSYKLIYPRNFLLWYLWLAFEYRRKQIRTSSCFFRNFLIVNLDHIMETSESCYHDDFMVKAMNIIFHFELPWGHKFSTSILIRRLPSHSRPFDRIIESKHNRSPRVTNCKSVRGRFCRRTMNFFLLFDHEIS